MPGVNNPEGKTSRGGEAEEDRTCLTFEVVGGRRGTKEDTHIEVIPSCSQVTLVGHPSPFLSSLQAGLPSDQSCLDPSVK